MIALSFYKGPGETGREACPGTLRLRLGRGGVRVALDELVGNKVIVGNAGGELGIRGWVQALDLATGKPVWKAYATGPDKDVLIIPDTPSFYRDPHKEHWGRLGIDATVPFARRHEYERKTIPGARSLDLRQYFGDS